MEIVDLSPEHEPVFLCCLKPYSHFFAGGVPRKRDWLERHRHQGVRAKLAIDDDCAVAGMIQYVPRPLAPFVSGDDGIWVVHCIWVHLYERGIGDRSGRGMGTALLRAAEEDMRARGARGVVAWGGLASSEWMNVPWLQRYGYRLVDTQGGLGLAFKAFDPDVDDPAWIKERKRPEAIPGKVRVSSFLTGWCTSQNLIHELVRRASEELGDPVVLEEFDTSDPDVVEEWGITTGVYVNGEELPDEGSETYEEIRDFIAARIP